MKTIFKKKPAQRFFSEKALINQQVVMEAEWKKWKKPQKLTIYVAMVVVIIQIDNRKFVNATESFSLLICIYDI